MLGRMADLVLEVTGDRGHHVGQRKESPCASRTEGAGLRRSWYVATLKRHAGLPHLADFVGLIRRTAWAAMGDR